MTTPAELEDRWSDRDYPAIEAVCAQLSDPVEAVLWQGLCEVATRRAAQGRATFRRALELAQGPTEALSAAVNRALDVLAEEPLAAVEFATFAVDTLRLEHPAALRVLAEDVALIQQDPVKAAAFAKRALTAAPQDPETHFLMAKLLARMGKAALALKHLKAAIKHANGLMSVEHLASHDPDFAGLRGEADFQALLRPGVSPGPSSSGS